MSGDVVAAILVGVGVLAPAGIWLEYRYAERPGRTLPPGITAQLEGAVAESEQTRVVKILLDRHHLRPGYKLVDLDMDDGRTFAGVWIVQNRWPTFSLRRAVRGFKPRHVVAVRPHQPDAQPTP